MGKYSWPREPEIIESSDSLVTTIHAFGNPTGITFWSYEVTVGGWLVGDGTSHSRLGARFGAHNVRQAYRKNRS